MTLLDGAALAGRRGLLKDRDGRDAVVAYNIAHGGCQTESLGRLRG